MFEESYQELGGDDGELLEKKPTEAPETLEKQYRRLPEKQAAILRQVASEAGLPEDLSSLIAKYEKENPKDPTLLALLWELQYSVEETVIEARAREIVELIK